MVRLLGGLVIAITTLYCGPKTRTGKGRGRKGPGLYPELAVLGISDGSSPTLASRVARMAALLPSFQQARDELARDGTPLNIKEVRRIALRQGMEVLTARLRDLLAFRQGDMPRGSELRGKRVGVAIDGGRVRTRVSIRKTKDKRTGKKRRRKFRTEWREPKLLIIFEMDKKGRMNRKGRAWIDGTLQGADECIELLAMHLHRLGAADAKRVTILADGAPWIWERIDWLTDRVKLKKERVIQVLDWCHAVHHVSLALAGMNLEDKERQKLYRQLRGKLKNGAAWAVTADLSLLAEQHAGNESTWTAIRYLEKHAGAQRMRYRWYRQQGTALGSGAIESAIRRVINLRLKGNGMLWETANVEAMLALRAALLTDRWEETLAHARVAMSRDRRTDWQWQSPDLPVEYMKAQESAEAESTQSQAAEEVTPTAA